MNPWLLTWHPLGRLAVNTVPNLIAAVLPNRTASKQVGNIMLLLQAGYYANAGLPERLYVSEQVRFSKRDYPYKVVKQDFEQYVCGGDPYLFARHVFNLKVSEEDD